MGKVKLIVSDSSAFCTRIEWGLKLKGVEYEKISEDLSNKSPILVKYNPVYKKVPVLVHDETPIAESLVILEYIDETWKQNPLLPQDPYERAMSRFWAKFSDDKCLYGAFDACWKEGEEKEKAIVSAMESFALLEEQLNLKGKKFFGGEKIGYLDLVIGWIPHWLNVMEEVGGTKLGVEEKFPCLNEWIQNFNHISLFKDCLPSRDDLVNYFTSSITYLRSSAANNNIIKQ